MKLSDNLKRIRKDNNLSQEQLAEKLGVSRQAVSKWESGQSYPEMDKVLLICKLFNYNIDELMNENVKEVDETKQSKININKYIDDFFGFITKTVDMLSNMKFKQKIKCIVEQLVVGFVLLLIFLLIGAIGGSVIFGIFGSITEDVYYVIENILQSVYIVFAVVVGVTILLHIFKIRYLDYYEIVKENSEEENSVDNIHEKQEDYDEERKIFIQKKNEKIIIRDPNHSQSKFLTGLFRIILAFVKFMVICTAICFGFTFISLFCLLVLSFMFVKAGLVFWGSLFAIISAIIVNFIILELCYNFVISKKSKRTRMVISFVVALILAGIGIGMILIGITQFNYTQDSNITNSVEEVYEVKMTEGLSFAYGNCLVEYVEEDISDVKIVVKHSKYLKTWYSNENETIEIYCNPDEAKTVEAIKDVINDINNREIKDYYTPIMYVHASKENIEKMAQNKQIKYNLSKDREIEALQERNEELETKIYDLEEQIVEKENEIESLRIDIEEKDSIINSLYEDALVYENIE